jgi:hypothetical protein
VERRAEAKRGSMKCRPCGVEVLANAGIRQPTNIRILVPQEPRRAIGRERRLASQHLQRPPADERLFVAEEARDRFRISGGDLS